MIFQSYLSMLYIRIDVCHLCLANIAKFCKLRTWRTSRKTLKRWWKRLDKRRVATESGDETGGPGDETGDKMAAMTGDERDDGGHRWGNVCGSRSVYNRRVATESGGDETTTRPAVPGTRPATRRRRRLVTNETAGPVG